MDNICDCCNRGYSGHPVLFCPVCSELTGRRVEHIQCDGKTMDPQHAESLKRLNEKYDSMLSNMQSPEWRAGAQKAFDASPEELGAAAVKQAKAKQLKFGFKGK
jgi:hypothetical protein